MSNVVIAKKTRPIDSAPCIHNELKALDLLAGINHLVVHFSAFRNLVERLVQTAILVFRKTVKICLYKIEFILLAKVVQLLIHFGRHPVIGLHDAYILSAGSVDTEIHLQSVAFLGRLYDTKAGVSGLVFPQHLERSIRASCVNTENLDIFQGLRQNAIDALFDIHPHIERRKYDGYFWLIAHRRSSHDIYLLILYHLAILIDRSRTIYCLYTKDLKIVSKPHYPNASL